MHALSVGTSPSFATACSRALVSRSTCFCASADRRTALSLSSAAALCLVHGQPRRALATTPDYVEPLAKLLGKRLGPSDLPEPNNIFLRILDGRAPCDVVDDKDPELFTFNDIRPASTIHMLVIPRKERFVRDASKLEGADDVELVRRMRAKAVSVVRARVGDAFDESELALGFHWPPWYSVPWLHLHAIYPRSSITRWYKYTPFSFYSPERVFKGLEGRGR